MSIPAIITAATVTRLETDFHELVFLSMTVCHYDTMSMLEFTNDLNSNDFCVPLANRCPENSGFHLLMIILVDLTVKILQKVKIGKKLIKIANQCIIFYQWQNIA